MGEGSFPPSGNRLAWVTGAGGLIGSTIVSTASRHAPLWNVRPLARPDLDLLDFESVEALFKKEHPSLVIHCAAISRNPECDANPVLARRVNIDATAFLAELCQKIAFFFFSTDLVFDGTKGNYVEEDQPNPLSSYSQTKADAERIILKNPRHTVIRTSLNAGVSPGPRLAFDEEMIRAARAGNSLHLFSDEFRCPIPASATAQAVWELAGASANGIYHLAGAAKLSRYEIGHVLGKRYPEIIPQLHPSSRNDYKGPPRPADTSLNSQKIQRMLSFNLPCFADWVNHPADDASG